MHDNTLKVANKIISYDDLFEIFARMNEKIVYYKGVSNREEMNNRMLNYKYQNWTFRDLGSSLQFDVNFYDDTEIHFDNYNNFVSIFNNRLDEIKSIFVYFALSYSTELDGQSKFYNQYIDLYIYENEMSIKASLSNESNIINDVYNFIKNKILTAPTKYDEIIKKKNLITNIVGLAIGFIPALIISITLIFIPTIRYIYVTGYIAFPIITMVLTVIIGRTVGWSLLNDYYNNIVPEKKYVGFNSNTYKEIYTDDIDKYLETSEILIGKNSHNLDSRNKISAYKNKYKKWIPYEIGIMVFVSIIILLFGM